MKPAKFKLGQTCKMAMSVMTDPILRRGDLVKINLVRRHKNYWQYGIIGRQKQIAHVREEVLEEDGHVSR